MRREKFEIWADILTAVKGVRGEATPSRLQAQANLPYDRFWRHVQEMQTRGLLDRDPLRTTRAGEFFLEEFGVMHRIADGARKPST